MINHKRTERLYRQFGLGLRRRRRKRLPVGIGQVLLQPIRPAQCWSLDFMSDTLSWGKPYRLLNVIDDYAREALAMEIDFSLGAERVKRLLEQLCEEHGTPQFIRSDNGLEFRAELLQRWAQGKGIRWEFIQPGKPAQNAFIERFNGVVVPTDLTLTQFSGCLSDRVKRFASLDRFACRLRTSPSAFDHNTSCLDACAHGCTSASTASRSACSSSSVA